MELHHIENDTTQGWGCSQSVIKLGTFGGQEMVVIEYVHGLHEDTRKQLLLRLGLSVIAEEERRLYSLTDAQAIAELDALKAKHAGEFVRIVDQS